MKRELLRSVGAMVIATVVLGLAYPLLTTLVAELTMSSQAEGKRVERNGKVVGSELIAQAFDLPVLDRQGKPKNDSKGEPLRRPDPRYFQPRPSVTGYSPNATYFANLGPNSKELSEEFRARLAAYIALEKPFQPTLKRADVPVDAVTSSASGVDPDISTRNAELQAVRISKVRKLGAKRVGALIDDATSGRVLGFIGEPGVNVLQLNLALDREEQQR